MKYVLAIVGAMAIMFCGTMVHAKKAKDGVQGRISSISNPAADGSETVVIMVGGKEKHEVTVTVTKDTKILIDGKDGTLADLKDRERVRVVGEKPATEIEILGKKPKTN